MKEVYIFIDKIIVYTALNLISNTFSGFLGNLWSYYSSKKIKEFHRGRRTSSYKFPPAESMVTIKGPKSRTSNSHTASGTPRSNQ
jgi:hypothetical protein